MPYRLVRQKLEVRATRDTIEVYKAGKRSPLTPASTAGAAMTDPEHMPAGSPGARRVDPVAAGPLGGERSARATAALVEKTSKSRPHPEHAYRACLGIMNLTKRYGPERVRARPANGRLSPGAVSYSPVKSILAEGLQRLPLQPTTAAACPAGRS